MRHRRNIIPYILCTIFICETLLFPVSWIISTAWQESGIISLLSPDGIRWFIGSNARLLATPYLVWLILTGISAGLLKCSGLVHPRKGPALQITFLMFLLLLSAIGLLSFTPHAILLSATGRLLNSSFSEGAVPMFCFVICLCSITYGTLASRYTTLRQAYTAALHGIGMAAPYILLYILTAQLYYTVEYILP
ncbi:MAG: hypothetical protein NC344_04040 [Bacteroidales bacterium]|nr:hypothetical protein [Bacteroidales bacterium]MCM1146999.1 hypothetical protein [Bacteroidales bacterium]MCM1205868.1 hypothetical protein [Bacillota bacterium]MCM1509891.1 hypothetical protein [Clostridium sp.]